MSMPDQEGGVWRCFLLIKADLKSSVPSDFYAETNNVQAGEQYVIEMKVLL